MKYQRFLERLKRILKADIHTSLQVSPHLQRLQRLFPVGSPIFERLDKRAGVHRLYLDNLIIQNGLDLISAADDEGP